MVMITDLIDPQELLGFARTAQMEEERNRLTLSNYLPNATNTNGEIEYRLTQGNLRDQDAATVRAWDVEAPVAGRQGVSKLMGELVPVSRKIRLGEEERLRLRGLDRGQIGSANTQMIDAIFNDAENMAKAVANRFELFRGEALEFGTVTINENGVSLPPIDFGRKGTHSVTIAGGATFQWNDITTGVSDPIGNMQAWVQTYIDSNGVAPAFALTSTQVISYLMRNPKVRAYAAGVGGTPGLITADLLNQILVAFGLPPVVPYDTVVRRAGTQVRPISANKVILMPPANEPLGATLFGTTAEALELAEARLIAQDQCPGMVAVPMKMGDPVATWTLATAVGLPVLANPDLTFVATVY